MEDHRCRQLITNDDALVEFPAGVDKPRRPLRDLSRATSFFVSTARREIHDGPLHRTSLPPTLQGFFFSTYADETGAGDNNDTDADEPPSPPVQVVVPPVPLKRYGHFSHLLSKSAAPFVDVDPTFSFLKSSLPAGDYIYLLGSCNGMVLFGHLEDVLNLNNMETCFIVCNPATQEWVEVPSFHRVDMLQLPMGSVMHAYLIFEPEVSSHFDIVIFVPVSCGQLTSTTVHAYSSEAGEWSTYERSSQERLSPLERWRAHISRNVHDNVDFDSPGAVVNGMLYLSYAKKWILEVDAQGKIRRLMPVPGVQRQVLNIFSRVLFIGHSQGHLHCIIQDGHGEFLRLNPASVDVEWKNHGVSIWVLQDHDAQEWVRKGSVSYRQLFGRNSCDRDFDYHVAALHPDCNVVFFLQHWDHKIKSYDIDRREVRALDTDVESRIGSITPYTPYLSDLLLGSIGGHE